MIDSTMGVHIFFILSGFLITTLLLKEKVNTGRISLKKFYIRRALRILPVLYLFLLVLIALNIIFNLKIPAADFLCSFLFYKNTPVLSSYYTAHLWSLAVEAQFYLTFPLLLVWGTNKYLLTAISIVIIVPVIAITGNYHAGFSSNNLPGFLLTKLCMYIFWKGPVVILIGSVFSVLMFKKIICVEGTNLPYIFSFILLLTAIVISSTSFLYYYKYVSEYLSHLLIACALITAIYHKNLLSSILTSKLITWVGILSYSLYIWQQLFVGAKPWQPWLRLFHNYPLWLLLITKLIFIFIIARVSYYFEKKFLKIRHKFNSAA